MHTFLRYAMYYYGKGEKRYQNEEQVSDWKAQF